MDEDEIRLLRRADLTFFGSVMAGQCHEVTNVLNIIHELAGLGEDLIAGADGGRPLDVERIRQVVGKIRDQALRGETMIRTMNRFAHSVDHPVTLFDLKEALEQIAWLAQRPARLRKITLESDFPAGSALLETNPFFLEEAVFTGLKMAFDAASEKQRVAVRYRILGGRVEIEVEGEAPLGAGPGAPDRQAGLSLLLKEIGGTLAAGPGDGDGRRIVFSLPVAVRGGGAAR